MDAATVAVAFEHIAACCAAGREATVGVGHLATCGRVRNPGLDSERLGACHLGPSQVTCPVVDRGLVDDGASGLVVQCAAVP